MLAVAHLGVIATMLAIHKVNEVIVTGPKVCGFLNMLCSIPSGGTVLALVGAANNGAYMLPDCWPWCIGVHV